ncbi:MULTISPECIES: hypothetical protein [unclassified Paenibacillus]|uniref:hypothetical protein n=1 Tax=unclassified Paenibacillus TaxID=185978 RepID=UPI002474253C|nr:MULTISPECIES: hypothetical protein [unclassified Paenibacillus]MDH6427293.1 hypothetical protein [Paenibacillus sp. PastH-4]MDH6443323.1 hypothetical protein [Paenibacillus sp. PastF-4]MDH6525973.1 hypothetical protein [Paenibacillus sp. PastH-3]
MAVICSDEFNTYNLGKQNKELSASSCPSDQDKFVAEIINRRFKESGFLEKQNIKNINFDVNVKKNHIKINKVFVIEHSGDVVELPFEYKISTKSKADIKSREREGADIMPRILKDKNYEFVTTGALVVLGLLFVLFTFSLGLDVISKEISILGAVLSMGLFGSIYGFKYLFGRYFE